MKNKILVFNGQYLPGFKGGGPIQSIANLVLRLHRNFDFYIVCADRDFKSKEAYKNVEINKWNDIGNAKVFYADKKHQSFSSLEKIINETEFDYIYLNGYFSPIFTLKPLVLKKFNKIGSPKVILSVRGDFTGGIKIKKLKKYFFIFLSKLIGLYDDIVWQATSEMEKKNILYFFKNAKVKVIPNLPTKIYNQNIKKCKNTNILKLINVSRIVPKKNLKFALQILSKVKIGKIYFDIYGPIEDKEYWNECLKLIADLPANIFVKYCGEISHQDVMNKFINYDFFFFPTLGENYGHVIIEALLNGCPVILSKDTTPWDDVEKNGSYAIELKNKEEFVRTIKQLVLLQSNEYAEKVAQVIDFSKKVIELSAYSTEKKYVELFSER